MCRLLNISQFRLSSRIHPFLDRNIVKDLVLATGNPGKIAELQALLSPISCIGLHQFTNTNAEETGLSFLENALIKARFASKLSGKPALADDSGLVVPALQGAPGIYSARFAGEKARDADNIALLLSKMENLVDAARHAFFYCAIAVVQHENDPVPLIGTGIWSGEISEEPAGEDGFGYDPVFYVPDWQCTAAQLDMTIKNRISHRAQALQSIQQILQKYLS